jgi:hypothetical protein
MIARLRPAVPRFASSVRRRFAAADPASSENTSIYPGKQLNLIRLFPVILSLLLLGAHYYRAGLVLVAAVCALLPLVLLVRRWWVPRVFQGLLVLGALEWGRTLYMLAQMRIAFDQPWERMALILGAVAVFTLLSALVFETRGLRRRYAIGG